METFVPFAQLAMHPLKPSTEFVRLKMHDDTMLRDLVHANPKYSLPAVMAV